MKITLTCNQIFEQLENETITATAVPSVGIAETRSAPMKRIHYERGPRDPSAVTGASILASLSNRRKDSVLTPPMQNGERCPARNRKVPKLASACEVSNSCLPDLGINCIARKGIFEQEECGFCCNDKIGIVLSSDLTAIETFHFDSVGLDARLDTDIRKISGLIMN